MKISSRWLGAALLCTLAAGAACRAADAPRSAASITDFRVDDTVLMKERAAQLDAAEAALARGDTDAALAGFERAAGMLHAPDTEMGLVRSQMQAGQYRRALAFAAHTAGAHLEAPAASALYAWLLRAGGQEAYARQVLEAALQRSPGNDVLGATQRAFVASTGIASGALLERPHRMAPQALPAAGLPSVVGRVQASAVLLGDSRFALAPGAGLTGKQRLWVRNGIGRVSAATVDRVFDDAGLVLLRLEQALPGSAPLLIAPRDPFAGSPGFAVDFESSATATPQWPLLHAGFFGSADRAGSRALGIATSAASTGAAVFDAGGRWAGIALPRDSQGGAARWLPPSQLRDRLGDLLPAPGDAAAPARIGADEAYERSLSVVLQVIVAP